jgi:hypothetical protein
MEGKSDINITGRRSLIAKKENAPAWRIGFSMNPMIPQA